MNDSDFNNFTNRICELKSDQFEILFAKFWEHFRYLGNEEIEGDAIAWRCKQAMMLIQHRKKPKLTISDHD